MYVIQKGPEGDPGVSQRAPTLECLPTTREVQGLEVHYLLEGLEAPVLEPAGEKRQEVRRQLLLGRGGGITSVYLLPGSGLDHVGQGRGPGAFEVRARGGRTLAYFASLWQALEEGMANLLP